MSVVTFKNDYQKWFQILDKNDSEVEIRYATANGHYSLLSPFLVDVEVYFPKTVYL